MMAVINAAAAAFAIPEASIIIPVNYVDKPSIMKNFLGEQRVWRRKKSPPRRNIFGKKLTALQGSRIPAADLIHQIRQKPAYWRRRRIKKPGFILSGFPKKPGGGEKKGRGFHIPVPSFSGVLFIAGILAVSVFGLFWQDLSPPVSFLHTFTPEPGADGEFQRGLASYAGISPLFPSAVPDEAIPLDLTETFSWSAYEVKKGDSVSKIAAAHFLSMDAIIASNGITNARRLREGDRLRIPNMDGIPYTVKKGDSLSKISSALGVPLEVILDANDIQSSTITQGAVLFIPGARMRSEDLKLALGELFIYPIRGRLTSPYGWRNDPISGVRRFHAALDLAAPIGVPVKASMDGRVSAVGMNATYGKFIILSHSGGYQTMYAHLNAVSVSQGDYADQGSKIGEVGNTGYSTGPHLHFAVYKNGRAVNPLDFLNR
ncbi:MAG: M23 family metallopeptidase [Treponema sp.]|jgi:murein DD-endopeptidase MepM/ murein hydrolase activator NlpD|nr:M23 family metallopeptidase [Treponema sp.]